VAVILGRSTPNPGVCMPVELNADNVRSLLNLVSIGKTLSGVCWLLGHAFTKLGVLRFIERAFLSNHMMGRIITLFQNPLPFYRSVWAYGCQCATCNVHLVRDLTFLWEEQQQDCAQQTKDLLLSMKAASSKSTPRVTQCCNRWKSPTGKHNIRQCCFIESFVFGRVRSGLCLPRIEIYPSKNIQRSPHSF
jgi:hypothetical protein